MTVHTPDDLAVLDGYRAKGLAGRMGFGRRPAVVVVDLIRGFTDSASPLAAPLDDVVAETVRLLDAARALDAPIFFTTTSYGPDCRDAGLFVRKVPSLATLQRGSSWVEVDRRLSPRPEELVLDKQYASAFFGTALASTLRSLRVDTVFVAGATTSGCIRATVVDAMQHGFRPIVPRSCVGDRADGPHAANLLDMDGKYGDVVELTEVLDYLRGLAA